ncbi:MAG: hypothetical protein HQM00_03010 [Magnetococcales bacterium]|nr:hypothetical protein [Magnetococcales bacterium]
MTTEKVAHILARLDRKTADRLLAHLERHESGLGKAVRDEMLLFEDLEKLDDRGLQTLLRETPAETLATALRGAEESFIHRCGRNLSRHGAATLQETLTLSAPIARQRVESARRMMLATARELEARGRLLIPSAKDPVIY